MKQNAYAKLQRMVRTQLAGRDITDPDVLDAFRKIDRAAFVPAARRRDAYDDCPQPIGHGQTISQPYMVAIMTQHLELSGVERVLEIGTGSGYQTAILAELAAKVYTIEYFSELSTRAQAAVAEVGCANVTYRVGNGTAGWPEHAPFDRILCAAAAPEVPQAWVEQLADPGILLAPVGPAGSQVLVKLTKRSGKIERREFCPCRFVPLLGRERDEAEEL